MADTPKQTKAPRRGKRGRVTDLPPCDVCGEKASGLHYGVNSCEACKAFFYRNFKRAAILTCEADDDCQPVAGIGFRCPSCRMKKCLQLDMSLLDIKKGRYTYERRAHLKKAINKREEKNEVAVPEHQAASPDSTSTCQTIVDRVASSQANGLIETSVQRFPEIYPREVSFLDTELDLSISSATSSRSNPTWQSGGTLDSPEPSEEEIMRIVQDLTQLYEKYPQYPPGFIDHVKSVQKTFLENKDYKNKVFGKLDPLPLDEYFDIYFKTGMDIDGRLEQFKSYCPVFEEACSKYVLYAQELPGFDQLKKEEKISLLKGAKAAFWMLSDYPFIDVEKGLYTFQNCDTVTMPEMSQFISEEYTKNTFAMAGKIQNFGLTKEECNVMRAYMIFNPDYCITDEGRKQVGRQRSVLRNVLTYLLNNSHSPESNWKESLRILEKELDKINEEDTMQWILCTTLFKPMLDADSLTQIPIVKALYESPITDYQLTQ